MDAITAETLRARTENAEEKDKGMRMPPVSHLRQRQSLL